MKAPTMLFALAAGLLLSACGNPEVKDAEPAGECGHAKAGEPVGRHGHAAAPFAIPPALVHEHEELHAELVRATKLDGRTGGQARKVAEALHPHFVREEEIALPPLGLLQDLAAGKHDPAMESVLAMTDALKAELPQMLAEHERIVGALEELRAAARSEGRADVAAFADKLAAHARSEEQVFYPAAILVGEYVKTRRLR